MISMNSIESFHMSIQLPQDALRVLHVECLSFRYTCVCVFVALPVMEHVTQQKIRLISFRFPSAI